MARAAGVQGRGGRAGPPRPPPHDTEEWEGGGGETVLQPAAGTRLRSQASALCSSEASPKGRQTADGPGCSAQASSPSGREEEVVAGPACTSQASPRGRREEVGGPDAWGSVRLSGAPPNTALHRWDAMVAGTTTSRSGGSTTRPAGGGTAGPPEVPGPGEDSAGAAAGGEVPGSRTSACWRPPRPTCPPSPPSTSSAKHVRPACEPPPSPCRCSRPCSCPWPRSCSCPSAACCSTLLLLLFQELKLAVTAERPTEEDRRAPPGPACMGMGAWGWFRVQRPPDKGTPRPSLQEDGHGGGHTGSRFRVLNDKEDRRAPPGLTCEGMVTGGLAAAGGPPAPTLAHRRMVTGGGPDPGGRGGRGAAGEGPAATAAGDVGRGGRGSRRGGGRASPPGGESSEGQRGRLAAAAAAIVLCRGGWCCCCCCPAESCPLSGLSSTGCWLLPAPTWSLPAWCSVGTNVGCCCCGGGGGGGGLICC